MTLLLLSNLGFAGGQGVTAPLAFGDLTTLFRAYLDGLQGSNGYEDADTLVAKDRPNVIAGTSTRDDANTMYCEYLS